MSAARLGAKMDSLSPFLYDSFIPDNMPVYPGALPITRSFDREPAILASSPTGPVQLPVGA